MPCSHSRIRAPDYAKPRHCTSTHKLFLPCLPFCALQEDAPQLLRGPDGRGTLGWWLNGDLALLRAGLTHVEAAGMAEQWLGSEAGQQLLAQLRCERRALA